MRNINITEADIDAVTTEIVKFASDLPSSEDLLDFRPPAVLVIDCVLSLNRTYDTFVVPRLETFLERHPEVQRITDLAQLIASYPTPHAFVQQELNYNHEERARILHEVVIFLCTIVQETPTIPEEKALKQWVAQARAQTQRLNIKGFGVAGFQYLCMLFGADTTKPDIHIIRFVSKILNRDVSDLEAQDLLQAACKRAGLSVRAVDSYIWNRGAREQPGAGETNVAHPDPDVDDTFPNEETAKEASGVVGTFDYTYKPVPTSSLAFKVAERCWWRRTSNKNLTNIFEISMKELKSLFDTDLYKQSVFNLMCVQYSEQGFEKWVQRYQNMAFVFSQLMKLDKTNHAKMLAGVRAFHASGGKGIKVMEQRQNPYK